MPATLSVDSFCDLVQRSRLLSAEQMQQVLQELHADGRDVDSPQALAEVLVDRELLTRWQVGFLLKGKHNGFFLGSYRFLKMLGKGGMGAVYLARHEMMRRHCAIKVLPTKLISDGSSVLERFYLEAQAVAALDDPNIVRAYDVNKEVQGKREIHYLVMEYVEGSDLQVKVEKVGPLDYVQVADFARQAASGLAHAHECGLIHRDIKPANLLLDEKGTVKILDLGLARFFDDRLEASLTTTHNESILGTADYLSPEQALDSHNVDTRTDIYSLGCTCYFMLTGRPPFPDGSVAQRLLSHQVKSPAAIEKVRPDVPVDLVTIVEQMIAKNPDDRYQTAGEVVDAFGAWLAQHADDDWKETHRDVVEGSASSARREPTRARSAATEETDLELGFAPSEDSPPAKTSSPTQVETSSPTQVETSSPTQVSNQAPPTSTSSKAELGLDELEELEPAAASLDTDASSSGVDDLLNEALENYPALDSNVGLASAPIPAKSTPVAKAEQIQLLKLILIGLAISIPLVGVVLFVLRPAPPPTTPQAYVSDAGSETAQAPQPGTEPVSQTPSTAALTDDGSQSENPPPVEATGTVQPATPAEDQQTPAPDVSQDPQQVTPMTAPETEQGSTTPTTPSPDEPPAPAAPAANTGAPAPATPSSPDTAPPANRNLPPTPPGGGDPSRDGQSDTAATETPAPQPPSPEKVKQLLAGLSTVAIQLDRKPKESVDLMVLDTAREALANASLKPIAMQASAPAVLTVSFGYKKADSYFVFTVGAELICRDDNSQEVSVWKDRQELPQITLRALKTKGGQKVLRDRVSDFYKPLTRQYRQARK